MGNKFFAKSVRLVIGSLVFVAALGLFSSQPWSVTAKSARRVSVFLSLPEAYRIGLETASHWNSSAKLYEMLSTDQGEDPAVPEIERGLDGRRVSWNLDFVVPGTERHLRLEIRNGRVVNQTEVRGPLGSSFFETQEVMRFHIPDNLRTAQREDLRPGRMWATGYHYRLFKDGPVPILLIRGTDPQGNPAIVSFNAETNQFIAKQRKLASGEWQGY